MQKANKATFKKKDGSLRTMVFYNLDQLPKEVIQERIKGSGTTRTLQEGSRVVYDLEARDFRIFNEKTLVGEIQQVSLDETFQGGYVF
jgi:hypothetical protein